jgi:hypothetical protein
MLDIAAVVIPLAFAPSFPFVPAPAPKPWYCHANQPQQCQVTIASLPVVCKRLIRHRSPVTAL